MTDASKTIGFVADKLSDAEIASPSLKRASFGAAYANHWGKIPTPPSSDCGVLWEVEPKLDPPAEIKPIRPKLWLLGGQNSQLTHCTGSHRDLLNHIWL